MKLKNIKKIIVLLILLNLVMTGNAIGYEEISNSKEKGVLMVDYEVCQSEEERFLNNVTKNYIKDEDKFEYVQLKKNEYETNHKEVETVIELQNIVTNNKDEIKTMVDNVYSYADDEGYLGELNLEEVELVTVSNGSYQEIEKLDISVSGLKTNDLSKIEKIVERGGRTWYFINAEWEKDAMITIEGQNIPLTYKGILHYETIGEYNNPDTYNAIIHYKGTVDLLDPIYLYNVTYKEIEEPQINFEPKPIEEKKESYMIPVVIVSGIGIVLTTVLVVIHKKKKQAEGGEK